jgi:hypothetical protein
LTFLQVLIRPNPGKMIKKLYSPLRCSIQNKKTIYCIAILCLTVIAVYAYFRNAYFCFDDIDYLTAAHNGDLFNLSMRPFSFRPVSLWLYWELCYTAFGLNPLGYHIVNMVLFVLYAALMFLVTKKLSGNETTAFIASFLIILHPMHIEEMSWIASASSFLVAIFLLGSFYAFLAWLDKKNTALLLFSLILYMGALLSREDAVMYPLLILAYSRIYKSSGYKKFLPYCIIAASYVCIRWILGLEVDKQNNYSFDLLDASNCVSKYYIFFVRLSEIFLNMYYAIGKHLSAILFLALSLCGAAALKDIAGKKETMKLVFLCLLWLIISLYPFAVMTQRTYEMRYLSVAVLGAFLLAGVIIHAGYRSLSAYSRVIGTTALIFVLACISISSIKIVNGQTIVARRNYFAYYTAAGRTEHWVSRIRSTYPDFKTGSRIYCVDFPWIYRVPELLSILYNDKSLRFFGIKSEDIRGIESGNNKTLVFIRNIKDKEKPE